MDTIYKNCICFDPLFYRILQPYKEADDMTNEAINTAFAELSTPLVADACLRLDVPYRVAPPGVRPVIAGTRLAGRARPARHYGSVDVFLEAMTTAAPGDVLVIDNGGRTDEACIGDLTALEARASGIAGMVAWGLHRDTTELIEIGFPVFSYGAFSSGPRRLDPQEPDALVTARFGPLTITPDDAVFADDDGVLFAPFQHAEQLLETAREIWQTERRQADAIAQGNTLFDQLRFADYLARRATDPSYSFRQHLRALGGAIEE